MQDKEIHIVRTKNGITRMMRVNKAIWEKPHNSVLIKFVKTLKRQGWSELDPTKEYIISTQHAEIELKPKQRKVKKAQKQLEEEESL